MQQVIFRFSNAKKSIAVKPEANAVPAEYEYGIVDPEIGDDWQVETIDKWLRHSNFWEVARTEREMAVKFGGHPEAYTDEQMIFAALARSQAASEPI